MALYSEADDHFQLFAPRSICGNYLKMTITVHYKPLDDIADPLWTPCWILYPCFMFHFLLSTVWRPSCFLYKFVLPASVLSCVCVCVCVFSSYLFACICVCEYLVSDVCIFKFIYLMCVCVCVDVCPCRPKCVSRCVYMYVYVSLWVSTFRCIRI